MSDRERERKDDSDQVQGASGGDGLSGGLYPWWSRNKRSLAAAAVAAVVLTVGAWLCRPPPPADQGAGGVALKTVATGEAQVDAGPQPATVDGNETEGPPGPRGAATSGGEPKKPKSPERPTRPSKETELSVLKELKTSLTAVDSKLGAIQKSGKDALRKAERASLFVGGLLLALLVVLFASMALLWKLHKGLLALADPELKPKKPHLGTPWGELDAKARRHQEALSKIEDCLNRLHGVTYGIHGRIEEVAEGNAKQLGEVIAHLREMIEAVKAAQRQGEAPPSGPVGEERGKAVEPTAPIQASVSDSHRVAALEPPARRVPQDTDELDEAITRAQTRLGAMSGPGDERDMLSRLVAYAREVRDAYTELDGFLGAKLWDLGELKRRFDHWWRQFLLPLFRSEGHEGVQPAEQGAAARRHEAFLRLVGCLERLRERALFRLRNDIGLEEFGKVADYVRPPQDGYKAVKLHEPRDARQRYRVVKVVVPGYRVTIKGVTSVISVAQVEIYGAMMGAEPTGQEGQPLRKTGAGAVGPPPERRGPDPAPPVPEGGPATEGQPRETVEETPTKAMTLEAAFQELPELERLVDEAEAHGPPLGDSDRGVLNTVLAHAREAVGAYRGLSALLVVGTPTTSDVQIQGAKWDRFVLTPLFASGESGEGQLPASHRDAADRHDTYRELARVLASLQAKTFALLRQRLQLEEFGEVGESVSPSQRGYRTHQKRVDSRDLHHTVAEVHSKGYKFKAGSGTAILREASVAIYVHDPEVGPAQAAGSHADPAADRILSQADGEASENAAGQGPVASPGADSGEVADAEPA